MADRSQRHLPYGHFGVSGYNVDNSTWRFERSLDAHTRFQILGEPRIVSGHAQPAMGQDDPSHNLESTGRRHRRWLKKLASLEPGLPPISDIALPLLRTSDAVRDTVKRHDSFKGNLFGYARIKSEVLHRSIPVAAMVTGESGSAFRIVQVQIRRQGWGDEKDCWLEVPTIHGEEATWNVGDGPVQQIRFAQPIDRGDHFLAVRYLTKISIFRPSHTKVSVDRPGASSISPNLLYSIEAGPSSQLHVDVTFNPWFPQQIAFVDQTGSWTVLEFQSSKMARVARSWTAQAQTINTQAFAVDDGWSRIAWICNLETVAICTRQSLNLFNIAANEPVLATTIDLGSSGHVPWVLDFVVLSQHPDHCFVLTSTHIIVCQVQRYGSQGLKTMNKVKIRHFKNPDDLSMRLSIWSEDQGVSLLLFSRITQLAAVYRFQLDETTKCIVGDPFRPWSTTEHEATPILYLQVRPLTAVDKRSAQHPHPTSALPDLRFLLATILRSDYSVSEMLAYRFNTPNEGTQTDLPVPTWESQSSASNPKVSQEPFIVDDTAVEVTDVRLSCPRARRARQPPHPAYSSKRKLDLELTSHALQDAQEEQQPAEEVLQSATSVLKSAEIDVSLPIRTLHSIAQGEVVVQDIQHISALLDEMVFGEPDGLHPDAEPHAQSDHGRQLKLGALRIPPVCSLDNELGSDSLATAYNYMLANWVGALSDGVPGRVKLAKVSMVRHIATEVMLAARYLHLEDKPEEAQPELPAVESPISAFTWNIPVRESRSQQLPSSPWGASQSMNRSILPTPSPTATPSVTTASSSSSSFAAPELYRLSKYTTFSKPSPMVLPRPLKKVLSHWTVGADPNDYDWLSMSKRITRLEEDEVDVEMTEKERRAMQRRAERHIKRQRKEAAASQAQQLASSQAPEILSASQPAVKVESQPAAMAGSSQSYGPGAAVASQVVPGRFGGRPPPKKKRKSGF